MVRWLTSVGEIYDLRRVGNKPDNILIGDVDSKETPYLMNSGPLAILGLVETFV